MVGVLPDLAGVGRSFSYRLPPAWADQVTVGTRVRVPLHGRRVAGWVVELDPAVPEGVEPKEVTHNSGMGPPPELVELARWAAWRWAGPLSSFLATASPQRVVRQLPPPPAPGPAGPFGPGQPEGHGSAERRAIEAAVAAALASPGAPVLARFPPLADLVTLAGTWCRGLWEAAGAAVAGGAPVGTVLVLVPGIEVAERLCRALERGGILVARAGTEWDKAAAGWPVVVGSRSAAWSPPGRLAGALVIDAHDQAYREERAPTSVAWEVVARRCARDGAPCLLVSPTPTAELADRFTPWVPPRPVERGGWPPLEVVDRRGADPRTGLLSDTLVRRCLQVLEEHPGTSVSGQWRPVVCVLNRRGRSRLLACGACRELVRCHRCGGSMHQVGPGAAAATLRCRRCGAQRPPLCAECGSTRLANLVPGVSRVREELAALVRCPVAEVAGPPTGPVPQVPVVVGTEAVLHRVRRAALVAFLDFDQHLLAPAYTAAEAAVALLVRAARMVQASPRTEGFPRVLVQTRLADHEVLSAARRGDPGALAQGELEVRRALELPPAAAWALVSGPAAHQAAANVEATVARTGLGAKGVDVVALEGDRWLVRAPGHRLLCDALAATERPRGRLRIEVDPLAL